MEQVSKINTGKTIVSARDIYCRLEDKSWYKVCEYDREKVLVFNQPFTFEQIWQNPKQEPKNRDMVERFWKELLIPLPAVYPTCWGYALTYPLHRKEIKLNKWFSFGKISSAIEISTQIIHRPCLDFEAEIGIFTHRHTPGKFAFIMINDLTDREIQLKTYNPRDPMPSFLKAKSFEGSLGVGPLIMIAAQEAWNELKIDLILNKKVRQNVYAKNCLLNPEQFHEDVFLKDLSSEWALIATGTGGGVLFRSPNMFEKLFFFTKSGFSTERTKNQWLKKLSFLKPGDKIEFSSNLLGYSSTSVKEVFRFNQ
ncbi:MAG: fumarylacetoacetate hydrolase family protein [Candidatus Omnitrophica bacterium]|nr:fumarylacetoacetate hydrolase family protein [Candidatus Omnitrophota bacterium]